MKTSNVPGIWVPLLVGLILIGLFVWLKGYRPPSEIVAEPGLQTPEAPSRVIPTTQGVNEEISTQENASPLPAERKEERYLEQMSRAADDMNVPISFYGQVVDQDNRPLEGVKVIVSIRQWSYAANVGPITRHPKIEMVTDSNGRFEVSNVRGDDLAMDALTKEGYEPEPRALRGFGYTTSDPLRPDPNSPVVFRIWKAETKAQLVTGSKRFSLIPDGRTYTIDLLTGAIAAYLWPSAWG